MANELIGVREYYDPVTDMVYAVRDGVIAHGRSARDTDVDLDIIVVKRIAPAEE